MWKKIFFEPAKNLRGPAVGNHCSSIPYAFNTRLVQNFSSLGSCVLGKFEHPLNSQKVGGNTAINIYIIRF